MHIPQIYVSIIFYFVYSHNFTIFAAGCPIFDFPLKAGRRRIDIPAKFG